MVRGEKIILQPLCGRRYFRKCIDRFSIMIASMTHCSQAEATHLHR